MDENFWTIIGTGVTVIAFLYALLRNFKTDIQSQLSGFENRIIQLEERMFYLGTGKTLIQAIKEQKEQENDRKL